MTRIAGNLRTRFEGRYTPEPNSGCWLWDHISPGKKYGYFRPQPPIVETRAHRVSYVLFRGPIPPGLEVCHRCDIPSCVNPDHLFLGTRADNMRDMVQKGRDNGPRGATHHRAILSENDVRAIRIDPRPNAELARAYGVSRHTIGLLRRGRTWKGVQ